ncbi:hypothetical protein RQP46_007453 [Phenoliferia psychrophenolica]
METTRHQASSGSAGASRGVGQHGPGDDSLSFDDDVPYIRTRSQSRQGMNPPLPPALQTKATSHSRQSSAAGSAAVPRSSSTRALPVAAARISTSRTMPSLAKAGGTTSSRRILNDANAGLKSDSVSELGVLRGPGGARRIAGQGSAASTTSRKFGKVAAAGMQGIGVVRTGPRVVDPQPRSPVKQPVAPAQDPFSLDFQPPAWTTSVGPSAGQKRAFVESTSDDELDDSAKRTAVFPRPAFDLTSPRKASSSSSSTQQHQQQQPQQQRPKSSPRLHFHHDDAPDATLLFPAASPSARMQVDQNFNERSPREPSHPPSSSPFPVARRKKQQRQDDSSEEDEIDFLSPRKKPRPAAGSEQLPPLSPIRIRSPQKKPRTVPPLAGPGPTSVAMQRSPGYSSPPVSAPPPPVLSIDPQLLSGPSSAPPPPTPGPRTGLATKFGSAVAATTPHPPATFHSAFGLPASTSYYASSSSNSAIIPSPAPAHAPVPAPTPSSVAWRSGIPRRMPSFANTPKADLAAKKSSSPPPPLPTLASFQADADDADVGGDVSMAEPVAPNSSMTSAGNTSIGGMGDETAKRLANLQAMLSRLAMPRARPDPAATASDAAKPRQSLAASTSSRPLNTGLGPRSQSAGASTSTSTARVPIPLASTSTSSAPKRKPLVGTASYRNEYSVPLAPAHDARPPPAAATRQSHLPRRQSVSTLRPTGPPPALAPPATSAAPPSRRTSIVSTSSSSSSSAAIDGELAARPMSHVLAGVIAFVDVRTGDGDDAGMIFVDMLKSMGARVTTRPTLTLTHIVYKAGRPGTLHRFRAHPDPKPFLVGISWVVRCAEVGSRVDEKQYVVESGKEQVFQKKRRSMEPKALASLSSSINGVTTATDPALKATIAASIERARRKSLAFAPKVGSPLAKRVWVMPTDSDEDE